jgi:tetratricopeptide (TPR) repeat protein
MKFRKLFFVCCACLFLSTSLVAQEPAHHHDAPEALGTVNFPVSCAPAVQKTFTRGMALLYSFEYEQAQRAFENVAKDDPSCAMAYWGQGMSLYHQLWDQPSKASLTKGSELLDKASALKATPREKDYLQALAIFYKDSGTLNHRKRSIAYSQAMKGVMERNPQDREAAVLYALSLLASGDENDTELTNAKAAVAILTKLFDEQPDHPGIAHYIIHSCDNPKMANLALPAARKYAAIAPASAHAVHMPSHIFARLGLWQDDIQSNLRAVEIANSMAGMHLHGAHHKIHSMDFLQYAYLQVGADVSAKKQVDAILAMKESDVDADFVDYFQSAQAGFAMSYAIERRQWKEAMALQPRSDGEPYTKSAFYWGRAVAAGHLHDAAAAQDALKHYDEMLAATRTGKKPYIAGQLEHERKIVRAWTSYATGKQDEAVKELMAVADEQDKIGKRETQLPAREMLADMLLEAGEAQEALAQYEISLKTDPNRFNGLAGAAAAAEKLQQKEKAAGYYAQLLKNCSESHSERPELQQAKMLVAAN